jgi:hypothetical protein
VLCRCLRSQINPLTSSTTVQSPLRQPVCVAANSAARQVCSGNGDYQNNRAVLTGSKDQLLDWLQGKNQFNDLVFFTQPKLTCNASRIKVSRQTTTKNEDQPISSTTKLLHEDSTNNQQLKARGPPESIAKGHSTQTDIAITTFGRAAKGRPRPSCRTSLSTAAKTRSCCSTR